MLGSDTVIDWSSACTVPVTTAGGPLRPNALPMATTESPTETFDDVLAAVRPDAPLSWIKATSCVASLPSTVAV